MNLPSFAACFGHSHIVCQRTFHRELTNVGDEDATYVARIEYYSKSLDEKVEIKVEPSKLKFAKEEKKKFKMKVKLCPRPEGYVSAALIWVHHGSGCEVASPIHLYFRSRYNKRVVYKKTK